MDIDKIKKSQEEESMQFELARKRAMASHQGNLDSPSKDELMRKSQAQKMKQSQVSNTKKVEEKEEEFPEATGSKFKKRR